MSITQFLNLEDLKDSTISYDEYFQQNDESINNPLIINTKDIHSRILKSIPELTLDQKTTLEEIFNQFLDIQEKIDPHRLKEFSFTKNDDDDLILFRNYDEKLINIIIYPEEDLALSIINKIINESSLEYFNNQDADFEQIVYSFLQ